MNHAGEMAAPEENLAVEHNDLVLEKTDLAEVALEPVQLLLYSYQQNLPRTVLRHNI